MVKATYLLVQWLQQLLLANQLELLAVTVYSMHTQPKPRRTRTKSTHWSSIHKWIVSSAAQTNLTVGEGFNDVRASTKELAV